MYRVPLGKAEMPLEDAEPPEMFILFTGTCIQKREAASGSRAIVSFLPSSPA